MGILELHFHDPTVNVNAGNGDEESVLSLGETDGDSDESPSVTGKLVPVLVLLLAIGLTVYRNRRRSG